MAPSTALEGDPTLVVAPHAGAAAGSASLGADGTPPLAADAWPDTLPDVTVDGVPVAARLRRLDAGRAILEVIAGGDPGVAGAAGGSAGEARARAAADTAADADDTPDTADADDTPDTADADGPSNPKRTRVLIGPARGGPDGRTTIREVVVDGWRFEVMVEPEQRARLRERARRGDAAGVAGGPVEVRAIIPGRVVAISVQPGDAVVAGQQILVVEAMKMQNELRAPREGSVDRVGVAVGDTIEIGDLLVVIH